MFFDTVMQAPSLEHQANILEQTPGVVALPPWGPYALPRVILRADLLTIKEIGEYISQMRQGQWESIQLAFRDLEDYCYPIIGPLYPFSLKNSRTNEGLELSMDPNKFYRSSEVLEKVIQAIIQTDVGQLTLVAGSDDIPISPTLEWRDLICSVDTLCGSNIHRVAVASQINMRTKDWEGLYHFATALGRSGITEFVWDGMAGQGLDRIKAAQIFREALTEDQWSAFGSKLFNN